MAAQGPATPSALYKMISIPEAQEIVLSETQPLPSVSVGFVDAVGSVLAENVQAPENVPPFPASIKVRSTSQPLSQVFCLLAIIILQTLNSHAISIHSFAYFAGWLCGCDSRRAW